jgi:hypothetical protein
MHFLEWFHKYARWSTIGWLSIIGVGAVWEIMGALGQDDTTFTALVRSTTPIWLRWVVLIVLIWHFCLAKANFK